MQVLAGLTLPHSAVTTLASKLAPPVPASPRQPRVPPHESRVPPHERASRARRAMSALSAADRAALLELPVRECLDFAASIGDVGGATKTLEGARFDVIGVLHT